MATTGCIALAAFVAVLNVAGFLLARRDKRAAQAGGRRARRGARPGLGDRIPERTFHVIALMGGALGTGAAFLMHHHKTRKARFLLPWAVAGLVGVALVAAWGGLLCTAS